MKTNPIISIIMPIYNGLDYLPRCLASIESQVYHHWELIIVDDGSTDGSSDFLDKYASSQLKTRIIHKANQGVSSARNTGIEKANGEFIIFHDSDDIMSPFYLSSLLKAIQCCPNADMAAGGVRFCEEEKSEDFEVLIDGREDLALPPYQALRYIRNLAAWGKIYRTETIKTNGLRFREDMRNGEDQDFVARYLMYSRNVALVHRTLMDYTVHTGSANYKFEEGLLPPKIYISHFALWTQIAKDMPRYWSNQDRSRFGESLTRRLIAMWVWINKTLRKNNFPARRGLFTQFLRYLSTMFLYAPAPAVLHATMSGIKRYGFRSLL